jgi:hypothetical protein
MPMQGGTTVDPSLRVIRKDVLEMEDGSTGQEKQTGRPS